MKQETNALCRVCTLLLMLTAFSTAPIHAATQLAVVTNSTVAASSNKAAAITSTTNSETPNPFEDNPGGDENDELLEHWNDPKHIVEEQIQILGFSTFILSVALVTGVRRMRRRRRYATKQG